MRQRRCVETAVAVMAVVAGLQPLARAHADVVTDWNVIALNATAVPANSVLQSRVLAIVHGAIYDTVRAIDQNGAAYAVDLKAPPETSVDASVAVAAHGVLVRLAPAQRRSWMPRWARRWRRCLMARPSPAQSNSEGKLRKGAWPCAAATKPAQPGRSRQSRAWGYTR